ncbi:MAG: CPBP family intramembrane glutamic endopeptidase [Chloroflexota bacterium]
MSRSRISAIAFLIYTALILGAELLILQVDARLGLMAYALIAGALLAHTWLDEAQVNLLQSLIFVPLIRMLSLAMPLNILAPRTQVILIGIALLIGGAIALWRLELTRRESGLTLRRLPYQLPIIVIGAGFGWLYARIIDLDPLVAASTWQAILPSALVLLVFMALAEELIFRGVMTPLLVRALGMWGGITGVAALFALLHLGYGELLVLPVAFAQGVFLGWVVTWSNSLIGVWLGRAAAVILLLLVLPNNLI